MGEGWSAKALKRVPAYAPGGELMKALLRHKGSEHGVMFGSGKAKRGDEFNEKLKIAVMMGSAKPIYRLREGGWLSGLHWAAYHNNPEAIFLLYILGIPVDLSNYLNEYEPHKLPLRLRRHSI